MRVSFFVPTIVGKRCVEKLESYIGELSGINHINVNTSKKTVLVEFSSLTNAKAIENAIKDAGYEAMPNVSDDF
ncbi:cation transporter [Helicobacter cetorum]|uniref:Putative heavy-metal-associated protein n=1 Tax=Helicobacter cetorum (strain ATCC BAA-429 / MIT 00-7128) TaxID=182217 RepID=I0ELY4_HELC0|nr:cation transporter [Helicobacter cetorum]AFI03953.1 putative heavy-metal-associated protein [Helicobacter cetorum MIT 00-7128]